MFFTSSNKNGCLHIISANVLIIGGINVKASILKAMQYGQIIDVMYMPKNGEVTKRRLKVIMIQGERDEAISHHLFFVLDY